MGTSSMEVSFIFGFSIVTFTTGGPPAELILCHLKWQSFLPTALSDFPKPQLVIHSGSTWFSNVIQLGVLFVYMCLIFIT